MIITYFDRKDDFKVKTRECYAVIPLVGNSEVLVKSKDLDPVFISIENIIYLSENIDNDLISREALKKVLSDPLYRSTIKDYGEILKYAFVMDIIDNAPTVKLPIYYFIKVKEADNETDN